METFLLVLGAFSAYCAYFYVSRLRHSISEARRSGFNYIVVPCSPLAQHWRVLFPLWSRLVRLLPRSFWEEWLEVMTPDNIYWSGWKLFERHGEAFLVVSPRSRLLYVANAEMITQIVTKKEQFPKWSARYRILRQFGENVITADGHAWRLHRKVTAASFSERNAALVFREAIVQTQGMLRTWTDPSGERKEALRTIERDTLRMSLHIIGYVGFGLRLLWPGQTVPENMDPRQAKYASLEPSEGHDMCFVDTMLSVMHNLLLLLLVPRWLLRALPFKRSKEAAIAYTDYAKYMEELMEVKMEDARRGTQPEGMDLMGSLVKCAYEADEAMRGKGGKQTNMPVLSREEIIGNAFIMFAAGHETSGGTMQFLLIQLATNPAVQRQLQRDIDELVGKTDPSTWDFDTLVNPMTASIVGACMYETLRILPPAVELPKEVSTLADQPITMDGREYVVPKGTGIAIVSSGVHLNPRYWPHVESKIRRGSNDLRDFKPERWFQKSALGANGVEDMAGADAEQYGGYAGPDTNAQLFRPVRGAYVPFSDGSRSCLGRRTAQAELVAMLAVVFREYSLELAVDDWASDAEVQAMSRDELASLYRRAQDRSRWTVGQAYSVITLNLHGAQHVPLRLVRRGKERFVDWMDDC
ncbi:cytochrome p450 3a21 [Purpureocillium lavendulum]|uniref:Cytochrome p450 3a21 n=1 Tax=Purpureocillium lavendulum TaxID=1247861 RepID=A0AB34FW38_9HYPO|nr:cytochrome p450 3a21 [Purpureocillium lavendulum]